MIWGTVEVKDGVIETNKHTFVVSVLTNFGIERPFLIPSRLLSGAFVGFTIAFFDLLYSVEIFLILSICGCQYLLVRRLLNFVFMEVTCVAQRLAMRCGGLMAACRK